MIETGLIAMAYDDLNADPTGDDRLIVVVGPCASGKTTLVDGLRALGFRARVCGQEHSEISTLWRRLHPDVTIALTVDLATIRTRRSAAWPAPIYARQLSRLSVAFASADITLDTTRLDPRETLRTAVRLLHDQPTAG